MNSPSFIETLKKKPHQSSTPALTQYQLNRPSSQTYLIPGKDSIPSKMSINIQSKGQDDPKSELKNFKTNYQACSYDILPNSTYKYDGYQGKSSIDSPTKKYGNMKNSYVLTQSRDSQLASDTTASDIDSKKKRTPRVSMPSFAPDGKNQMQQQYSSERISKNEEKESYFGKKRLDEKQLLTPQIDYKERLLMRKSSTEVSKNWQPKFSPTKREKQKTVFTLQNFEQIRDLGAGKYGKVFLVREKETQMIFALKIIEKKQLIEEEITEQFIRQLKIQLFLNHPNIIKMYGFFDDAHNIYIILEAGMGGQLFKYLKKSRFSQQKTASIMRQICQAVSQLHSNQIIHRDIKPQNIVMHENIVKLCDFGWSVYRDQKLRNTFCGTPLYVCPEILKGKSYDEKIDIWSLGVMMYEMLIGENPFNITKQEDLIRIVKESVNIPEFAKLSEQASDFLHCCLQKKPEDRKCIRQLLHHDFFKKYPEKSSQRKMGI